MSELLQIVWIILVFTLVIMVMSMLMYRELKTANRLTQQAMLGRIEGGNNQTKATRPARRSDLSGRLR